MVLSLWNMLHKCPFPNGDWDSSSKSSEKMYQLCQLKLVNHFGDWTFAEHVPQLGPPSSDLLPQMSRVSSSSSSSDDHQTRRRHSMKIVHGVLNYDTESRIIMTT
jgi:hypothetical protein